MIEDLYTKPLALVVIAALALTVIFLVRWIIKLYDKINLLQDKRADEFKLALDKLVDPIDKLATQQELTAKQNDAFINIINQSTKRSN